MIAVYTYILRYFARTTAVALVVLMVFVAAPVGAQERDYDRVKDALYPYFDMKEQNCSSSNLAPGAVIETLPEQIPEPYRTLFPIAASKAGANVALLTTIFFKEWGNSFPDPPPPYGNGRPWNSSPVGASGPFQFMPTTWSGTVRIAQDELGISISNVNDLTDAALGASVLIRSYGAEIGKQLPLGDVNNYYGLASSGAEINIANILASYNAGPGSGHNGGGAETRDYVKRGLEFYQALTSNSLQNYFNGSQNTENALQTGIVNTGCANGGVSGNYANLENIVYYGQCFPEWADVPFSSDVVCTSGCGPTSTAMVIATLTGDKSITPTVTAEYFKANGHVVTGVGTSWSAFTAAPEHWGLKSQNLGMDLQAAIAVLRGGGLVIASVGPGHFTKRGHIIVLRGVTADNKILVADPNDSLPGYDDYQQKSTTPWDQAIIQSEASNFWGITK